MCAQKHHCRYCAAVCALKKWITKGFLVGGENFLVPFIEFSFLCDYIIE